MCLLAKARAWLHGFDFSYTLTQYIVLKEREMVLKFSDIEMSDTSMYLLTALIALLLLVLALSLIVSFFREKREQWEAGQRDFTASSRIPKFVGSRVVPPDEHQSNVFDLDRFRAERTLQKDAKHVYDGTRNPDAHINYSAFTGGDDGPGAA